MTTEYHDPDGVFPLLWPQLSAHLPLRNLYWKSPTRPLRAIASLDVDFVSAPSKKSARAEEQSKDVHSPQDTPGSATLPDAQRRHQIPGLRSTPYLKLYLLRCDDKDLYKSNLRPKLRDWVKEHVTAAQNSSLHSNHDAFEWLILHVVLPDTPAAAEPRFSNKKDESGDVKERTSKWTGKRNRPLLEKLRADFNEGKAGSERVAQIRLARDALPPGLTRATVPAGVTPIVENAAEQSAAWTDLIGKFKALLLSSFNVRVSQYEEDVRERELQRSLPGWNFCTFFMLKEGLAQAFEAIGLTDDALLGYDELAAGLDSTIGDQLLVGATTSQVLTKTLTLHEMVAKMMRVADAGQDASDEAADEQPILTTETKDYRGLIVSNQISVFDFRCYIFLRQMELLLKLARLVPSSQNSRTVLATQSPDNIAAKNQDATPLAELSQRAARFASLIGRTLQDDLADVEAPSGASDASQHIDATVASWTFSFLQQILDETITSAIASPASMQDSKSKSEPVRHYSYPRRQSSLLTGKEDISAAPSIAEEGLFLQDLGLDAIEAIQNGELANAAACRADLMLRQRRLLEQLGEQYGWRAGSLSPKVRNEDALSAQADFSSSQHPSPPFTTPSLRAALTSASAYRHLYELLSDHAAWYYAIAGRRKSAEQLIINQALLKFDDGDYAAAVTYFSKLAKTYGAADWHGLELSILEKYAECLKLLKRKDELVRVRLSILARSAVTARQRPGRRRAHKEASLGSSTTAQAPLNGPFAQLVSEAKELTYDVTAPLTKYFNLVNIDKAIELASGGDGFRFSITVQQLFSEQVTLDEAKVQLVQISENGKQDIWLHAGESILASGELGRLWLNSNISTYGLFRIARIVLRAGRVLFSHDVAAETHSQVTLHQQKRLTMSPILLYPRLDALRAELREHPVVHLGKQRILELIIHSGDSDVSSGKVTLKSATAGLRLYTAKASFPDASSETICSTTPGEILLPASVAKSTLVLHIPHASEQPTTTTTLAIQLSVDYATESGGFTFRLFPKITTVAALDVSVQDTIKQEAIWSKFWIKPITDRPIQILGLELIDSERHDAKAVLAQQATALISARHPVCASYRISKRTQDSAAISGSETVTRTAEALTFQVSYRDIVEDAISQKVEKLRHDLAHSTYAGIGGMLVSSYADALRENLQRMDVRSAELTGKLRLLDYNALGMGVALDSVHVSDSEKTALELWLSGWHEENAAIDLQHTTTQDAQTVTGRTRKLLVDYHPPTIHYAFSAALSLTSQTPHLKLGHTYPAQLHLRYTTAWSQHPPPQPTPQTQTETKKSFTYEVLSHPSWLISGPRLATFEAEADEDVVVRLSLTPLVGGVLGLPVVRVRLVTKELGGKEAGGVGGLGNKEEGEEGSLQVELKSQWQTVSVDEGLGSTTVSLGTRGEVGSRMELLEAAG